MATTTYTWAIQIPAPNQGIDIRTFPYKLWRTPEEAIAEYTKETGKSWEQLQQEGAKLVKQPVEIRPPKK